MGMPDATDPSATAVALTAAMRRLRARLRQESPPALAELTMPQALALARIVEEGPIANAALAAGEYMRPQSTHEMVLFLEGRGLVERRPDPADRRKLLIGGTPERAARRERAHGGYGTRGWRRRSRVT